LSAAIVFLPCYLCGRWIRSHREPAACAVRRSAPPRWRPGISTISR